MRAIIWILSLCILCSCKDDQQLSKPPQNPSETSTEASVAQLREDRSVEYFVEILTPIIDPAKLDTLKGKRAAHTTITQGLLLAPDGPYSRFGCR